MVTVNTGTDKIDPANVSVNLHFFLCGIKEWFHHNMEEDISLYYGHGMDQIIYELYPYAEILERCWHKLSKKIDSHSVLCYEICEDLAARLYVELLGNFDDNALIVQPGLKDWGTLTERLIILWNKNQLDYSNPLLSQITNSDYYH